MARLNHETPNRMPDELEKRPEGRALGSRDSRKEATSDTGGRARETVRAAKQWTSDKTEAAGEKPRTIDEMLQTAKLFIQKAAELLENVKDWTSEKARMAEGKREGDAGNVTTTAQRKLDELEERANEALSSLETGAKDVKDGRPGADLRGAEIRLRIARCEGEIAELEDKIEHRSNTLNSMGSLAPDREVQSLYSRIAELKKQIGDHECELGRSQGMPSRGEPFEEI